MKKQILLAALIVISVSAYSQTKENARNEHGTEVNSVAKVKGDATLHGETVSTIASSNAQNTDGQSTGRMHREGKERRSERPDKAGSATSGQGHSMSGAGIQRSTGAGLGISARTGVQGKISRPGIRSNIRVNAGIRNF